MALSIPHRTWTDDDVARMARAGILRADEPVRLLGGEIVTTDARREPRRWTFDEYLRLAEEGIIRPGERTELIDGEIVPMSPTGRKHRVVTRHLNNWLKELLGAEVLLGMQDTLRLGIASGPEPDIVVLRYREDEYLDEEPDPAADVRLIVEVAESSLSYDRGVKRGLYAGAGVPEYWLVDLKRKRVIVYGAPLEGVYRDERQYRPGERWISMALDGRDVRVEDVLGPAAAPR